MAQSLTGMAQEHDFSTTFTAEYDNDQTAAAIITPSSGKLLKITDVRISTEGGTSGGEKIRLYFGTTGDTVASVYCTNAVQNTNVGPIVVRGAVDEVLKITSNLGVGKNYIVHINYKEE